MTKTHKHSRIVITRLQEDIKTLVTVHRHLIDEMVAKYESDLDLKAIARMALIKAATKFPLASEHEFASYAVWWISIAIRQELGLPLETAENDALNPEE